MPPALEGRSKKRARSIHWYAFLFCSCRTFLKNPLRTMAKFVAPPGPGGIPSSCAPPASFVTPGGFHQRPRADMPPICVVLHSPAERFGRRRSEETAGFGPSSAMIGQ